MIEYIVGITISLGRCPFSACHYYWPSLNSGLTLHQYHNLDSTSKGHPSSLLLNNGYHALCSPAGAHPPGGGRDCRGADSSQPTASRSGQAGAGRAEAGSDIFRWCGKCSDDGQYRSSELETAAVWVTKRLDSVKARGLWRWRSLVRVVLLFLRLTN